MKIVIDISKHIYEHAKEESEDSNDEWDAMRAIANGTPLPKGHGRLIDADEAIKILKSLGNRDYRREKGTIQDAEKMLSSDKYTPTIIEEDEGSEAE